MSINKNESKENFEDFYSYDENKKKQIKNKSNKLKPKNINTNVEKKYKLYNLQMKILQIIE